MYKRQGSSGSIVIDTGTATTTTGSISIGTVQASAVNIGKTSGTSQVNIYGGSGGINVGDGATNITIDIGGVTSSNSSTVNIATNATAADTVNIGSNHSGSVLNLTAGATSIAMSNSGITNVTGTGATAYNINSPGGIKYLNIDTTQTNGNFVTNPSVETNLTSWSARTGTTLTRNTTLSNVQYGVASASAANTATIGAGTNYALQLSPSTAYCVSAMVKVGAASTIAIGYSSDGSTETSSSSTAYSGSGWQKIGHCFTTPGSVSVGAYIFIKQTTATAQTLYIDGLRAAANVFGTPISYFQDGQINLGTSGVPVLVGGVPAYASPIPAAAMLVQQAGSGSGLIVQGKSEANVYTDASFIVRNSLGENIIKVGESDIRQVQITGGESFYGNAALTVSTVDPAATAVAVSYTHLTLPTSDLV